jgi:putative hydrolase of the HAD superfamily
MGGPGKAICIDIGGVLSPDYLGEAAEQWGARLGRSRQSFLSALFAGSDDQVLIGRQSESSWWRVVAGRLQASPDLIDELRRDLASRQRWDADLVALLRRLHGRAAVAIVSNAWPQMRASLAQAGLASIADAVILSCEAGCAKPDARIYQAALDRLAVRPGDVLFVDDTPGHVAAAESLGMAGHVHTTAAGTIARIEDFLSLPGLRLGAE